MHLLSDKEKMTEEGVNGATGDVASSLDRIERKLDAMTGSVNDLSAKLTGIDNHLITVETQLGQLDDLVADQVKTEIGSVTKPMLEDIQLLERKVDDVKQQLHDIKESIGQDDDNKCAVIVCNFPSIGDDADLTGDILAMFGDVIKLDVGVTRCVRFKSYSDKLGPVYVVLCNETDKVTVLENKSKLSKHQTTKKIRIEKFMSKQEVLARDNWSMIIEVLGEKGKHLRVAGTG